MNSLHVPLWKWTRKHECILLISLICSCSKWLYNKAGRWLNVRTAESCPSELNFLSRHVFDPPLESLAIQKNCGWNFIVFCIIFIFRLAVLLYTFMQDWSSYAVNHLGTLKKDLTINTFTAFMKELHYYPLRGNCVKLLYGHVYFITKRKLLNIENNHWYRSVGSKSRSIYLHIFFKISYGADSYVKELLVT